MTSIVSTADSSVVSCYYLVPSFTYVVVIIVPPSHIQRSIMLLTKAEAIGPTCWVYNADLL